MRYSNIFVFSDIFAKKKFFKKFILQVINHLCNSFEMSILPLLQIHAENTMVHRKNRLSSEFEGIDVQITAFVSVHLHRFSNFLIQKCKSPKVSKKSEKSQIQQDGDHNS